MGRFLLFEIILRSLKIYNPSAPNSGFILQFSKLVLFGNWNNRSLIKPAWSIWVLKPFFSFDLRHLEQSYPNIAFLPIIIIIIIILLCYQKHFACVCLIDRIVAELLRFDQVMVLLWSMMTIIWLLVRKWSHGVRSRDIFCLSAVNIGV